MRGVREPLLRPGRPEHAAHESLRSEKMVAEVELIEKFLLWLPWTSDEELRRSGGVLIWQEATADTVQGWLGRFPGARINLPIELPVLGVIRNLSVHIHMTVIPPREP